jgi:uncharacterized membrane protein YkoI
VNAWRTALLTFCLWVPLCARATAPHEMSMEQAVQMVERQYHARVVKAESHKSGERTTYVLKLLNDSGRVWTVHVDAASGVVQ